MARVRAFRGWHPPAHLAEAVACLPENGDNCADGDAVIQNSPRSFVHVTKPALNLLYSAAANKTALYAQAAHTLQQFIDQGVMLQDAGPCLYAYELILGAHQQMGVVVQASLADYEAGIIKKHAYTQPDRETDRLVHMQQLQAQSGPVVLLHRDAPTLAHLLQTVKTRHPQVDFVAPDGVRHRLWRIDHTEEVALIVQVFASVGPLYIARGHHRAAAAARLAAHIQHDLGYGPSVLARGIDGIMPDWAGLLAVAFAASDVHMRAYNRVVHDFNGGSEKTLRHAIQEQFGVTHGKPEPILPRQFGMYLQGQWSTLYLRPGGVPCTDPVACLDVSILQDRILGPLLGIQDPSNDTRLECVSDTQGDTALEQRVQAGCAVAFKLCPVRSADLLRVADAGRVMPPKSIDFAPQIRDGLLIIRF